MDEQTGEPSPKRKKLSESKFVVIKGAVAHRDYIDRHPDRTEIDF